MLQRLWRRPVSIRGRVRLPPAKNPIRQTLTLEALEAREVPSITLVSASDPSFVSESNTAKGQSEIAPRNSISDSGRYLVFASTAYDLVEGQLRTSVGG